MIGYVTAFAICSIMAGRSRRATSSGAAKNAVYPLTLGSNRKGRTMATESTVPLGDEELETILAIARNRQSGRITEYEIKELVRGYREHIKNLVM